MAEQLLPEVLWERIVMFSMPDGSEAMIARLSHPGHRSLAFRIHVLTTTGKVASSWCLEEAASNTSC